MKYNFETNNQYARIDVKTIVGAPNPEDVGGNWYTGYTFFNNCLFIFATLETPGRTGHNYNNVLKEDKLYWFGKTTHSIHTDSIKKMLSGNYETYIFTRKNSKNPNYIFQGLGYLLDYEPSLPVHIVWGLGTDFYSPNNEINTKNRRKFIEGVRTSTFITRYERNPHARKVCLEHHGYSCKVCKMKFEDRYGQIGKEFIHVHHLVELSSISEEYEIDPMNDLVPVCPNCHAMLHRRKPTLTPQELKDMMK